MGETTKIEWCDHTFNPWLGCTKVSAGCANCYAERQTKRMGVQWGPLGPRRLAAPSTWRQPLTWNRAAAAAGVWRRVFCASLADVFEDWQGQLVDAHARPCWLCEDCWQLKAGDASARCEECEGHVAVPMRLNHARVGLCKTIDLTQWLNWLLVTKRPERIRECWPGGRTHRRNVWLLTSIENQERAEQRIPDLLACRDLAPVLGLSIEPLLEWVDISDYLPRLDWVIVGGESGPDARTCNLEWIESIVEQCRLARVPCFVKQLGSKPFARARSVHLPPRWTRDPKGGDPAEWPEQLRVREFPTG